MVGYRALAGTPRRLSLFGAVEEGPMERLRSRQTDRQGPPRDGRGVRGVGIFVEEWDAVRVTWRGMLVLVARCCEVRHGPDCRDRGRENACASGCRDARLGRDCRGVVGLR